MTLKTWVWIFTITALVVFHVWWYCDREDQKVVEYKRGYASGLARACDIVLRNPSEVIVNNKKVEIVREY